MMRCLLIITCLLLSPYTAANDSFPSIHHDLQVTLAPNDGQLRVIDRIQLTAPVKKLSLLLHGDLKLQKLLDNIEIDDRAVSAWLPLKRYTLQFPIPTQQFTLTYEGTITHDLRPTSQEYSGGRSSTPGLISDDGVFLSSSSFWYPQIDDSLVSFNLQVTLPKQWRSVSQGEEISTNRWRETQPQDDIYLIAAPFQVYNRDTAIAKTQVFIRAKDDALATRYLDATEHYLQLYSELLGDYPYAKFALVENFWESGYGMPSFTLLGPRVIRFYRPPATSNRRRVDARTSSSKCKTESC
ncbi:MAG: hypothetical protein MI754_13680 [Chromatiales bacterium]|nr:hypothetical protein [Chromatiales bacterium]